MSQSHKVHVDHSSDSESDLISILSSQPDPPTSQGFVDFDFQNCLSEFGIPPAPMNMRETQSLNAGPSVRTFPFVNRSLPATITAPTKSIHINTFFSDKLKRENSAIDGAVASYSGITRSIPAGAFEILLVLDNREVRSRKDRDYFQVQLEKRGVKVLTMMLELGDVCWVAREKDGNCVMLDYIVERKGKEDLISSLQDGRFKEQKVLTHLIVGANLIS